MRTLRLGAPFGAAAAVAATSIFPARALSYDAWGWLIWGQEVADGRTFSTNGFPSWKPLVGLVSMLLAPLGDAAPTIWLLIARAAAVIAIWLAYRLAARLAGPVAGGLAALALLIVPQWLFQAGVGESEPLLTALLLGAVARHADRDHLGGFLLVLLASLLRPESWPFLLVSGVLAWRRGPVARAVVLAGVALVPVLWYGGEYIGSHDPFRGSYLAKTTREAVRLRQAWSVPAVGVLDQAWRMVPLPLLVGALPALVAGWRRRQPVVLALGGGALIWVAEVAVLAQLGYAGVTRFLFPAAAGLAVVGAAGLVQAVRGLRGRPLARAAVVAVAVALALPAVPHALNLAPAARRVEERADLDNAVDTIVTQVGRPFLFAAPHLAAQGETVTPLAWRLHAPAESLRRPRIPGLALADRNQRWRGLRRALLRSRRRPEIRIVTRAWALRLLFIARPFRSGSGAVAKLGM